MTKLVLIAVGGGVGAVTRYLLSGMVQKQIAGTFPAGTLLVNVVGCFLIGLAGAVIAGPVLVQHKELGLAITVGFLGGFTTFSAFGWETMSLISNSQYAKAFLNVTLNNGLGLGAVLLGYRLAGRWFGV